MPRLIIEELHSRGIKVFLLAIKGITSQPLIDLADESVVIHITQIGKAIKCCLSRKIDELIMAGRVRHDTIYKLSLMKMDWTTVKLWMSMKDKRTDTILSAIAKAFEEKGVAVIESTKYLQKYLVKRGTLTKKKVSEKILRDIELGREVAYKLGEVDVGQTVVIKEGAVVAVEAMEGTDRCLDRAFEVGGEGAIVVKCSKLNQDMRFDVPTIGKNTIEKLIKIKASALALEAEKTLLVDEDAVALADNHGVAIIAF